MPAPVDRRQRAIVRQRQVRDLRHAVGARRHIGQRRGHAELWRVRIHRLAKGSTVGVSKLNATCAYSDGKARACSGLMGG